MIACEGNCCRIAGAVTVDSVGGVEIEAGEEEEGEEKAPKEKE